MIKGTFSITTKIKCSAVNFVFFLVILALKINGQTTVAGVRTYIETHADEAIYQMVEYKIPASVTLAQAIFESSCGTSVLAKRSNNHFGIKCHIQWGGDTIRKSDDTLNECFRKYNCISDSYTDHSIFLKSRPRYKALFNLSVNDYKGWCYGLKNSGYATSPFYPEALIKIIEQYGLFKYDRIETLTIAGLMLEKKMEKDIIISEFICTGFSLEEFCNNDLLWNNEKHVLIQSLEMIIEHPEKEIIGIAEND
jgi:hypothetical protein